MGWGSGVGFAKFTESRRWWSEKRDDGAFRKEHFESDCGSDALGDGQ